MLVLQRDEGERIVVDGPCVITVVRIGPPGHGVRLGIEAASNVNIVREELADGWNSRVRGRDVRVLGGLVTDHHIPVLDVGEASGDVGRVVREDGEE